MSHGNLVSRSGAFEAQGNSICEKAHDDLASIVLVLLAGNAADLFIGNLQFGEVAQVGVGLLVGGVVAAGVGDLAEHGAAIVRAIQAQALGLREKKPADRGGSSVWALAIGHPRPAFAPRAAPSDRRDPGAALGRTPRSAGRPRGVRPPG